MQTITAATTDSRRKPSLHFGNIGVPHLDELLFRPIGLLTSKRMPVVPTARDVLRRQRKMLDYLSCTRLLAQLYGRRMPTALVRQRNKAPLPQASSARESSPSHHRKRGNIFLLLDTIPRLCCVLPYPSIYSLFACDTDIPWAFRLIKKRRVSRRNGIWSLKKLYPVAMRGNTPTN
jgi:hypothetical protein